MSWLKHSDMELLDVNHAEQMFFQWLLRVHTSFSHGADPARGSVGAHILTWSPRDPQSDCHVSVPDSRDIRHSTSARN